MRISIPKTYFELFDYLNTQPVSFRVSNWPVHSPFGWAYYDWYEGKKPSFQGAGFLYFGIKQPLLDRDFDRWSPYNESYYRQVSYAIYKQDSVLLKNVLKKYKVGFVLLDQSVVNPQSSSTTLYVNESKSLLTKTGLILAKKTFGQLELFKLSSGSNLVASTTAGVNVLPQTTTLSEDSPYGEFGDYITSQTTNAFPKSIYPFRDLTNNQFKLYPNTVTQDKNNLILTPNTKLKEFGAGTLTNSLQTIPTNLTLNLNKSTLSLTFKPSVPSFGGSSLSLPQTQSLTLPQSLSNLIFAINDKELIDVKNLKQNSPLNTKTIELINGTNNLAFFDLSNKAPVANVGKAINPYFSSCDSSGESPTAVISNTRIKLTGKKDLCIFIPYSFLPSAGNETILSSFGFDFSGDAEVLSCLYDVKAENCISYTQPVISGHNISFAYALSATNRSKMQLRIFIKPKDSKENTYLITNINAWIAKPVANLTLTKDFMAKMFTSDKTIAFDKLTLPKSGFYNPETSITQNRLVNSCKAISAKKEITNGIIKYSSIQGSFCDYYSYSSLPHDQGYLIAISSTNVSGLPLTLCVTNYTTKRCDIYADLSKFKSQGTDYFVLAPSDTDGLGYDLNFENLGIKSTPSVNYLNSIQFMPIPYGFLENIKTNPDNTIPSFSGTVVNAENSGSLHVTQVSGSAILTLNQSFEEGFKAYAVNCSFGLSCRIKGLLAPIIGIKINEHVLINGWANGWIIKQSDIKTYDTKIVIVYLPQYFEYLGFLVSLVVFIVLLIHKFIENHR